MSTLKKWRGLKALVQDSVDSVSRAVERVHKDTSKRWFDIVEAVPPVAAPVRVVRTIHDTSVTGIHEIIRLTNRVVGAVADGVMDALENIEAKKGQAETAACAPEPTEAMPADPAAEQAEPPRGGEPPPA
jgi:hypothetical protein